MQRYYVKRPTGKVFGPFDENAIRLMLEGDKIGADAQVSTDKQAWKPISDIAAFADILGNRTQMGVGQSSLPRSTQKDGNSGPQLPRSKSGNSDLPSPKSDGGGPALPTPKSSGDDGPALPTPKSSKKGPALPTPKSSGDDGPALPTPKPDDQAGPQLPTPKSPDAELPRSGQDNLPRSGQDNLPRSGPDNLPRSGQDNLPRSGQDNLPRSGQDNLPRSSDDNLPGSAPPPTDPPDDDDLFGSPIDDDDDLFGSPEPEGLDEDSSDLFGSPDDGLDEDSSDLFGSPDDGLGEESSDLFGSPEPEGLDEDSSDLFGSPDDGLDEDSSDLFGSPDVDASASEPDPLEDDDDDLFEAPEMDDDDLFADAPGDDDDDDDFLGGDDGFSFLDDEPDDDDGDLEDWEEDLGTSRFTADDLGGDDDWGDDLLDDEPDDAEPDAPQPPPSSPPPSSSPEEPSEKAPSTADDRFRPASRGIQRDAGAAAGEAATTSREEAEEADKKRGSMTIVGVALVGVLLFAGGGFGIYHALQSDDGDDEVRSGDTATGPTEIHPPELQADNHSNLISVINQPGTDEMDSANRGLLLVAKSLFLTRYDDDEIAQRATSLADELDGQHDTPAVAIGLAAHQARLANPEATQKYAEPVADDEDFGFFAHLSMGVADANAHFEGEDFDQTLDADDESPGDEADAIEDIQLDDDISAPAEDDSIDDEDIEDDEGTADDIPDGEIADEDIALADRAASHLEQAASLSETSALPHYWLARIALHIQEPDEALEHLEAGIDAAPGHVASRLQAGQLYYQQGHLNDAAEHLDYINQELADRASDAERGHSLHLMGLVHRARQESEEAIDYFTRALNADNSRTDTLRALAREYEYAEMYEDALNFFTTDENLGDEDPEVILGIVRSHMGLENWDAAIEQLERGAEQFPNDARFSYYLGVFNEQQGNFYEAQQGFEEALNIDPDLLTAHASLAQLAWRVDEDHAAGSDHIRAIVERPDEITANIAADAAEFFRLAGDSDRAIAWNEEALRRDPNYWPARLALAQIQLDEESPERALEILERSRDEGVQDLQLSAYLADAYRQNEQFEHAIEEINEVIAAEPEDENYIFIRGLIEYDRGNYATARDDLQDAYTLNPRFHDANFYIGRTHLAEGDQNTAIRLFRHVLNSQPDNGEVHYFMGLAHEADGAPTRALNSYSNAIRYDRAFVEDNPDVLVRRGRILSEQGRTSEAHDDIETALEFDPHNHDALKAMGILNFDARDYDNAIEQLSEVLDERPDDPEAQYKLGMSYLHEDRNQDAARHLKLAVEHGYDDPEIHRTRGYLYRDMGQRNDAINAFTTYLEEGRDRPAANQREVLRQLEDLGG